MSDPERAGRLPAWFISRVRAAVGGLMLLQAVLGEPSLGHYPVVAWTLLLTAVGYALAVLLLRWRRSAREWVIWSLIGVDTVLIALLAGVTGGGQSPFAPVLLLVVSAVGIRFGFRRVAAALGWTVPLLAALILFVPEPARSGEQRWRDALWWSGYLIAGAVLSGVLADRLDFAHRRRAQAESAAAVERQRLELERDLRHRLEALDEGRRAFLNSLLHEFRPSVSSLSTLARALRRDEHDLTADERGELLERIDSYAHHLDTVLREVAEVLTSESLVAEHRLHHADIYLPQLVGEAAALSGLGPDRVVTRSKPGDNVIRSDPDKALRVLVKLLEEAGRRAPAGTAIEVDIRRCEDRLELCVTPGGTGEDAWLPGGQPPNPPSLGLWIAARLAEAMGGGLEAGEQSLRAWLRTS